MSLWDQIVEQETGEFTIAGAKDIDAIEGFFDFNEPITLDLTQDGPRIRLTKPQATALQRQLRKLLRN